MTAETPVGGGCCPHFTFEHEARGLRGLFPGPKSEVELGPELWRLTCCLLTRGGEGARNPPRDPPRGPADRGMGSKGEEQRRPRGEIGGVGSRGPYTRLLISRETLITS